MATSFRLVTTVLGGPGVVDTILPGNSLRRAIILSYQGGAILQIGPMVSLTAQIGTIIMFSLENIQLTYRDFGELLTYPWLCESQVVGEILNVTEVFVLP